MRLRGVSVKYSRKIIAYIDKEIRYPYRGILGVKVNDDVLLSLE